jgi:hypothetical protein
MLPTSQVSEKCGKTAKLEATSGRPRSFVQRGLLAAASMTLVLSGLSGCMTVHNGYKALTSNGTWNDTVVVLRNRNFATKAWHRRKHHFCNEKFNGDFKNGFCAGYEAAASGADGCTPAFPPKEYWSWEFQSAEGQSRTSAWFSGYPQGVRAAEEDGIVNWNQLQMGANLQAQYQQNGTFEHQGALYPIPSQPEMQGYSSSIGAPTTAFPVEEIPLGPGETIVPMPE